MTGLLEALKKENNIGVSNTNNQENNTINIPLVIESYNTEGDIHYAEGYSMITKELIKVKLREVSMTNKTEASERPEIKDFKNTRHARYSEPKKSVLCFDACYLDTDGMYSSRWAQTLTSQKYVGKNLIVDAFVNIVPKDKNKPDSFNKVSVDMIVGNTTVNSMDEFNAFALKVFHPKLTTSRNYMIVTLKEQNGDSHTLKIYPKMIDKVEDDYKVKIMDTAQNSLDDFYQNEAKANISKFISDALNLGNIEVRLFNISKIYAGEKTVSKIFKLNNGEDLKAKYMISENVIGFRKTIITYRERNDGSYFATFIKPVSNNVNEKKAIEDY